MFAEFFIMFRESLEIALVLGIILAYLHVTKNQKQEKNVYLGASAGLVASMFVAYLFQSFLGGFEQNEELFEGVFMLATSVLITWLLLWMFKQTSFIESLRRDVKTKIEHGGKFGLFILAFTIVFREGVEIVLFMYGLFTSTGSISLIGALLGVAAAVVIGVAAFYYSVKFNLSLFFKVTMVVLVLLAAGLFSRGVHELQEANVLPTFIEHIYDITPKINPDGSYPVLHEKGAIGGVFRGLLGYDGNPSDLQVAAYLAYVLFTFLLYKKIIARKIVARPSC